MSAPTVRELLASLGISPGFQASVDGWGSYSTHPRDNTRRQPYDRLIASLPCEPDEVRMNSCKVTTPEGRLFTKGLAGCLCTLAIRPGQVQLCHYDPTLISSHMQAVRFFEPDSLVVWYVPEAKKAEPYWKDVVPSYALEMATLCQVSALEAYSASTLSMIVNGAMQIDKFMNQVEYNAGDIVAFGSKYKIQKHERENQTQE